MWVSVGKVVVVRQRCGNRPGGMGQMLEAGVQGRDGQGAHEDGCGAGMSVRGWDED